MEDAKAWLAAHYARAEEEEPFIQSHDVLITPSRINPSTTAVTPPTLPHGSKEGGVGTFVVTACFFIGLIYMSMMVLSS
jgi:hypothetical protein